MAITTFFDSLAAIPAWKKRYIGKFQTDVVIQINETMKARRIGRRELARRGGFTLRWVRDMLSGTEALTLEDIARIEEALGADVLVVPMFADEAT